MKKIKFVAALLTCLLMCVFSTVSFAASFTYEQVADIIDAVKVDGVKVFKDRNKYTFGSDFEDFFTQRGAVLFWLDDIDHGEFWFYKNGQKEMICWEVASADYMEIVFDILGPILDDYIDYDIGGKISFFVSSSASFNNPFIGVVEYSPKLKGSNNEFMNSNFNDFIADVEMLLDIVLVESTTSPAMPEATPTYNQLEKGSKGDAVKALQERLNELGYSVGTVDGDFGGKTHNAVCDFQRDNDLEATGVVDAELNAVIFSATTKTKAEIEALKNSPEGFRLDIAAAKAIGDKFASGNFNGSDKCTSSESSSDYRFYVQDYDTKNGELQISCSLDKAKGANNIDTDISIEYIIPLGSGLWRSEPNMVVISTNKGSHTLPSSMWSWLAGSVYIDFDNNISLFKEIAESNEFNIVLSNSNPSTLTYGSFSKNSVGFKGIKTVWKIWEAARCTKLLEIK